MKPNIERERQYYDALKRISTVYDSADKILKNHNDEGLSGYETLEYAYDNLQLEAKRAIKGMRRP